MTSEHRFLARADNPQKERDAAFAVVDAAFRTAADDLQSKQTAAAKLIRSLEVLTGKYQAIAEKAQRYQAWCQAVEGGRE
jgi:hypothetical protein